MTEDPRVQELITLKTIAETMNQSNDMTLMGPNTVLEKLLELTACSEAGSSSRRSRGVPTCVADLHLPPGLLHEDKEPMRCGTCWCLDRFWSGRLNKAVPNT